MTSELDSRRPLKSRSNLLVQNFVNVLLKTSVTPNQISVLSIVFALIGACVLLYAPQFKWLYLVTLLCVQLRLLCNLLDGMVAIEGKRGSPIGSLYNEIPDRIADSLFLVAWGYACNFGTLGWAAALVAAVTAYIRVLGGSLGQKQDFSGPMAKQQRMAALSIGCFLAFFESMIQDKNVTLEIILWIVLFGSLWTCVVRTRSIAGRMG
jgi:phosphatidylglycerophosphate synthase